MALIQGTTDTGISHEGSDNNSSKPEWSKVKAIAEDSCGGFFCHDSYEHEDTWKKEKATLREQIESEEMPRFPESITDEEKKLLLDYLDTL